MHLSHGKLIKPFYFDKCCTNDSMEIAAISIVNELVNESTDLSNTLFISCCIQDWDSIVCVFVLFLTLDGETEVCALVQWPIYFYYEAEKR